MYKPAAKITNKVANVEFKSLMIDPIVLGMGEMLWYHVELPNHSLCLLKRTFCAYLTRKDLAPAFQSLHECYKLCTSIAHNMPTYSTFSPLQVVFESVYNTQGCASYLITQ